MELVDLDLRLHDAVIALDTVRLETNAWTARGWLEDEYRGKLARFQFCLQILDVESWELYDDARIGEFFVDGVVATDSGLEISSPLPMKIVIATRTRAFRFELDDQPSLVRKFFRWVSR